ncbi:MAG: c-type cytochrome [Chromatiales bacterium]|jgi:cytochrome c5
MRKPPRLQYRLPFMLGALLTVGAAVANDPAINSSDLDPYNLGLGRVVFTEQCIKCHGSPESGAPQLGSVKDWETRLKSPVPTLINHAINGHGKMPPKGGLDQLTDRHVAAAVAFVVDRSRTLFVEQEGKTVLLFDKICDEGKQLESCKQARLDNTLLLQMFWLITGQQE